MTTGYYRVLAGRVRRGGGAGLVWLAASTLWACSGGTSAVGPASTGEMTRRETAIVHQDCPVTGGGTEKVDVNSDGRPDISIVRSGSREVCRAVDLNFDGTVDTWVYNDGGGTVARRENDYDRDGRIDEVAIYKAGVIVEKHRATTLAGKLDTWHFYQAGKLARTERDSDGDAVVDQWWEYPKADQPECPLIHSDVDGDGKPDPGATVDVCAEYTGYVPPERGVQEQSDKGFERSGSLPTELEQKPMENEGEPKPAESEGEKAK